MKCELCDNENAMPRDTKQFLCEDCDSGKNTLYCHYCCEVIHEDYIEWFGSSPRCTCGEKLEL